MAPGVAASQRGTRTWWSSSRTSRALCACCRSSPRIVPGPAVIDLLETAEYPEEVHQGGGSGGVRGWLRERCRVSLEALAEKESPHAAVRNPRLPQICPHCQTPATQQWRERAREPCRDGITACDGQELWIAAEAIPSSWRVHQFVQIFQFAHAHLRHRKLVLGATGSQWWEAVDAI
mmetsp:Transcript_26105/g.71835  ORF Transcript_26105/g.71835 Transcript_26105/m.71835 type:complete len:177 (-) Transcript_26105:63-593(-)